MSGHSHWSTIKRKKEANDQQKGREFSKVSREILLAVTLSGNVTDPNQNIRLRAALAKAREVNMPKDNIARLLDRIKDKAQHVTEVVYEAIGQHGVTYLIKTATDNSRRTQTDIKIILDKAGAKLVAKGAVMYNYDLLTMFTIENYPEEAILNLIEALGAVDFVKEDKTYYVYVLLDQFNEAWQKATELGFSKAPELVYKPKVTIEVDAQVAEAVYSLIEKLSSLEEIQEVYTNLA
ncbi:hypothetical protein A2313_00450 [Candidatus Roizmanbacteria bacterium RIFOXYB2_FULL_41_10]|uniref:Probable transcriptional regulatory protein A2209_04270 n=1 Tax=Candidatus Roizmanbacteria bacterium RIFOXYA1_FULL_41_12 TaxID=1802082 RepID=A0A1F7KAJ3_9BACT|nr:MAG: hypothetical protein A2209_04270 [Candidatus Roizmanbacteria bacterium RIFOXYA1_FULL_41_12]OGK66852.1 MAG: hypothetical protein A2377_03055 [Candidatus Roizmanbacteria bacterium RIFOXYB1_FULL_41_27]OGK70774.1 MAG: hypothetical protein A2403_01650 [Candidatus Roizmanbacteria bacterium RIFOXYC1_FULL_41_16]OGK71434.1 MAG: hypothetical protein A2313_00450 [Candidatus Roizmanbacteria bacterium RIFOXYB2_FULL_41_10]OGK75646.1 MAG: hypothetical protein A2575_03045 [Candidatus Roizmanbacteria ba